MSSPVGMIIPFPTEWKHKNHVWKHQPECISMHNTLMLWSGITRSGRLTIGEPCFHPWDHIDVPFHQAFCFAYFTINFTITVPVQSISIHVTHSFPAIKSSFIPHHEFSRATISWSDYPWPQISQTVTADFAPCGMVRQVTLVKPT